MRPYFLNLTSAATGSPIRVNFNNVAFYRDHVSEMSERYTHIAFSDDLMINVKETSAMIDTMLPEASPHADA